MINTTSESLYEQLKVCAQLSHEYEKSFISSGIGCLLGVMLCWCSVAHPHSAMGWSAMCDWHFLVIVTYFFTIPPTTIF